MIKLAPDLFQRRFEDLLEMGRAELPALAPEWTDYNAHDPGITLMELLAWTAEAQMYSLSRVSQGERSAFASLAGIKAAGSHGATGTIWADPNDPESPAAVYRKTMVIPEDAAIRIVNAGEAPLFNPAKRLLFIPGRIEKLETRATGGRTDHTHSNDTGVVPFAGFGAGGPNDVLAMQFTARDVAGMFGMDRTGTLGAYWPLGFRVAKSASADASASVRRTSLAAELVTDDERIELKIVSDTTNGFLTTGAVLLDLDAVSTSYSEFTIELRSPAGFIIQPALLRVEPNVVPIRQGRTVAGEVHAAAGFPDLSFLLDQPGIRFAAGEEPVKVEVLHDDRLIEWQRCDRLSTKGPNDTGFEFDPEKEEVRFGNGVNGMTPPAVAQILVTYSVSDGEAGNTARNRKWSVQGFEGVFGINPEPVDGGAGRSDLIAQRRDARAKVRGAHALVTPADLVEAAKNLSAYRVARAWVVMPGSETPRSGEVVLVVMQEPDSSRPSGEILETGRWLAAIRRGLAPRMPLGSRLAVKRPEYSDFRIEATIEATDGMAPDAVAKAVQKRLGEKLTLTGADAREPGVSLNQRDVFAWVRGVEGVQRIAELALRDAAGNTVDTIKVPGGGLPRWMRDASTIRVVRVGTGGGDG